VSTGQPTSPAWSPGRLIAPVVFGPDSRLAAVGLVTISDPGRPFSPRVETRLWDPSEGQPVGRPMPDGRPMTFLAAGRILLLQRGMTSARFWDVAAGLPLGAPVPFHPKARYQVSPDGNWLLMAIEERVVQVWDARTGRPVGPPIPHPRPVKTMAISPDGATVLTVYDGEHFDDAIRFWDAATGRPIGPWLQGPEIDDSVGRVGFASDGGTAFVVRGNLAQRLVVPRPIPGDPARLLLWAETVTGLTLDDRGRVETLDATDWLARRDRLKGPGP
jgi:hypothetical protein